jgi:hypothetical protein
MQIEPYLSYTRILNQEKSRKILAEEKFETLLLISIVPSFINQSYKRSSKLTIRACCNYRDSSVRWFFAHSSIGVFSIYGKILWERSPRIFCFYSPAGLNTPGVFGDEFVQKI